MHLLIQTLSLRHIINYKVLKPSCPLSDHSSRLRHIINYKVLKPSFGSLSSQAPFKTYHKLQGSQTISFNTTFTFLFKTYHKLQGSQTTLTRNLAELLFKTYHKLQGSQTSNLKPQIGHHRTHTTCDSCNLCTLLFYNQTPVAVNNMTPIFYVCQFQLPLLKKYKVYLFILSRLA